MSGLLPLEEAQQRLLALAPKLETEPAALTGGFAGKRYLAADITAKRTQPAADLSAMDGYAVTPGEGPWQRVGESRAGAPFEGKLEAGQCTRISTGAHMPQGADRVQLQEDAQVDGEVVSATEPTPPRRHIRRAGFDFSQGNVLLAKGDALTPAAIALAIAAGHGVVPVVAAPKVAILDSGDELVPAGEPLAPHQIPASNGAMLASMVTPYVGAPAMLGPVPDDASPLAAALEASEDSDILITSGGASVGDHDLVQQALKDWGADLAFWKVAIKPGKPLMVATRAKQVVLGLPGNPVSSFVTCFLFALPLIRAAMGARDALPQAIPMTCEQALPTTGPRCEFVRGIAQGGKVRSASSQDSSALRSLAMANCLIERHPHAPETRSGEQVDVYKLQNG